MKTLTLKQADRYRTGETEFIFIGSVPHDENCTPAGYSNLQDGKIECIALISQLRRMYGKEPEGCEFFILENHHEFGIYHEAAIFYNIIPEPSKLDCDEMNDVFNNWWNAEVDQTGSEIYALKCEMLPDTWDNEAISELRKLGHSQYQPAKVIKLKVA